MAVTIKDVAEKLGVSISTVSKALNGVGTISAETTARILAEAGKMGYRPNSRARSFASRTTYKIMFLASLPVGAAYEKPHIFEIIMGLEDVLSKGGYSLVLAHTEKQNAVEKTEKIFCEGSVDAFIFHASIVTKRLASLITNEKIPHLVVGQPDFESQLCWVDSNNALSGEMAVRHLLERNYYPVAFIGGRSDDMISYHRYEGVKSALESKGLSLPLEYVFSTSSTILSGTNTAKKVLALGNRPRAIICANNAIAFGVVEEVKNEKISIPGEVAIITFDRYPFASFTEPRITAVDVDMFELGKEAGEIIIKKIRHPDLIVQNFTTFPVVFEREST